jgi:hypothetical protein
MIFRLAVGLGILAVGLMRYAPIANADPVIPEPVPIGPSQLPTQGFLGSGPVGVAPGIGAPGVAIAAPTLAPAAAGIFLCPGVGAAGNSLGGGGGYCDSNFSPVWLTPTTVGIMHIHCEWGGFVPIAEMWQCWRVWPGQPDHPKMPDPDIIPDGMGVPWAINGPSPNDQWPIPGLMPAGQVGLPPVPTPQVFGAPEPLQPGPPGLPNAPPGPSPIQSAPVPFGEPLAPPPGPFNPPGPPPEPPPEGVP